MSKTATPQPVEPEVKQVYQSSRGPTYQLLYVDEQIVLMRSDEKTRNNQNGHRIEIRSHFDNRVGAGFFEYLPESDLDLTSFEKEEWGKIPYIGAKTEQSLYDEGIETVLDVRQAEDATLLEADGLGKTGLQNLRDFAGQ